jgi:hypothetical protein
MVFQCRACELKQEPSLSCKRCGKVFAITPGRKKKPAPIVKQPDPTLPPVMVIERVDVAEPPPIMTLAELERELIIAALVVYNPVQAAGVIGIGKTTLYRKMRAYGLVSHDPVRFKNGKARKKSYLVQQQAEINPLLDAESAITQC